MFFLLILHTGHYYILIASTLRTFCQFMGSRTLTEYISIVSISLYAWRFKILHFKNVFYHYLLALSLPRQTVTPWHAFRFLLRRFMPRVKMCDRSLHNQNSLRTGRFVCSSFSIGYVVDFGYSKAQLCNRKTS